MQLKFFMVPHDSMLEAKGEGTRYSYIIFGFENGMFRATVNPSEEYVLLEGDLYQCLDVCNKHYTEACRNSISLGATKLEAE